VEGGILRPRRSNPWFDSRATVEGLRRGPSAGKGPAAAPGMGFQSTTHEPLSCCRGWTFCSVKSITQSSKRPLSPLCSSRRLETGLKRAPRTGAPTRKTVRSKPKQSRPRCSCQAVSQDHGPSKWMPFVLFPGLGAIPAAGPDRRTSTGSWRQTASSSRPSTGFPASRYPWASSGGGSTLLPGMERFYGRPVVRRRH